MPSFRNLRRPPYHRFLLLLMPSFCSFLCHHFVSWGGLYASISYFRWCHHFIIWSLDHRLQVHRSFNILSLQSKTGVLFYKWCVTKARMCWKSLGMILQNWWHRSSMSQALFVQFVSWDLRLCIFTIKLSSRLCLAMVMSFFLELYMHTFFKNWWGVPPQFLKSQMYSAWFARTAHTCESRRECKPVRRHGIVAKKQLFLTNDTSIRCHHVILAKKRCF